MVALGLDVGDRRIGVAVSDPTGLIARPLTVVQRHSNADDGAVIRRLVDESGAEHVVVGLPRASDTSLGAQARKTLGFVRYLRRQLTIPVSTWDERFSTHDAQEALLAAGVGRAKRKAMLDAAAAAVILDEWLTAQRG